VPLFFYTAWDQRTLAPSRFSCRDATDFLFGLGPLSPPPPAGTGFGLLAVYLLWILGVLLLYPACRWFAGVKARRRDWWLSYL
jgi:hypothetical protein